MHLNSALEKYPPSAIALLLQCLAFSLIFFLVVVTGLRSSPLMLALLCGLLAATFSYFSGLAKWWLAIQLLFAPAVVLLLSVNVPTYFFLGAFLILLLVYGSVFRSQVPLYLSSNKVHRAIEIFLPVAAKNSGAASNSGFTFMDLGSGLGGILTHLAKARPDGIYSGVEIAPLPFLWGWLRAKFGGYRNCHLHWGDFWEYDLAQYDVIFAYLSPVPMAQLWRKARAEMRPGTLFISSTFAVPEQTPHEVVKVDDLHRSTLLIWHM